MTQKEKAKRYDEALEIAKKNYITAQDLHEGSQIGVECFKNTIENIFPELKESEDERIRKAILEGLIYCRDEPYLEWSIFGGIKINDCITWIENQSEQKPADWSEEDGKHIDSLLKRLDGLCRNEFERTRFAISEDEDWLKSLKERIGE